MCYKGVAVRQPLQLSVCETVRLVGLALHQALHLRRQECAFGELRQCLRSCHSGFGLRSFGCINQRILAKLFISFALQRDGRSKKVGGKALCIRPWSPASVALPPAALAELTLATRQAVEQGRCIAAAQGHQKDHPCGCQAAETAKRRRDAAGARLGAAWSSSSLGGGSQPLIFIAEGTRRVSRSCCSAIRVSSQCAVHRASAPGGISRAARHMRPL